MPERVAVGTNEPMGEDAATQVAAKLVLYVTRKRRPIVQGRFRPSWSSVRPGRLTRRKVRWVILSFFESGLGISYILRQRSGCGLSR